MFRENARRKYPREVYAIKHNVTKKIYVGSTSLGIEERYKNHIYALRKHKHTSKLMQEEFNEFGEDYSVYLLDTINSSKENHKEYDYMRKYKTYSEDYGYNQGDFRKFKKSSVEIHMKDSIDDLDELNRNTYESN